MPQSQFFNERFCPSDYQPDQLGNPEVGHVVHNVRPPPERPEQSQLGADLPGVDHVVEDPGEEVQGKVGRIERSADVVLLLLVPDHSKIIVWN